MKTLSLRRRRTGQAFTPRLGLGGDLAGPTSPSRTDPDVPEESLGEPNPQATFTTGSRMAGRAVQVGLAVAIACGPAAIVWRALTPSPTPVMTRANGMDAKLMSRRSVAAETAATWVQAWLTTPTDKAAQLQGFYPEQVGLPPVASRAANVRVAEATASAPSTWVVTVGADVTPPQGAAGRRYFQVVVAVDGGPGHVAASPVTLPAPVPAPQQLNDAPRGAYTVTVTPGSPLAAAVQAFITAMLTGTGDVSRYTTPGVPLRPVFPAGAGYASATVVSIQADHTAPGTVTADPPRDGATVSVLVDALLLEKGAPSGSGLESSYPLTLTARGGRWEISAIDTALKAPDASAPSQPTTP